MPILHADRGPRRAVKNAAGRDRPFADAPERVFHGVLAVLFDLDGTLIETHIDFPLMKRQVLAAAARHGLDPALLAPLDILGAVEAARIRLQERGDAGDRLRAECFEILRRIEVEQCANPVEIPGAAAVVERLHQLGIAVGVVTRNSRDVSERLLAHARIVADTLVARDDVARAKPDPLHLLEALSRLGFGASSAPAAVMVGDHPMDIEAGRGAHMRTVGVINGGQGERLAACHPDMLVAATAELLHFLPRSAPPMSETT